MEKVGKCIKIYSSYQSSPYSLEDHQIFARRSAMDALWRTDQVYPSCVLLLGRGVYRVTLEVILIADPGI